MYLIESRVQLPQHSCTARSLLKSSLSHKGINGRYNHGVLNQHEILASQHKPIFTGPKARCLSEVNTIPKLSPHSQC
ncbi:hypothetical protein AFLA_003291 [Aspergillus flavus NRRL3357]|nr:hypothetical protein AFLA_003291 [Aspergillus flavus NRRL3357]